MRLSHKEVPILSKTSVHALKALTLLAATGEGRFADAAALAEATGAPPNYLAKLLGQLAKAGIVEARKGLGGGFRLARPAAELSLHEILNPLGDLIEGESCILGESCCRESAPCALHGRWASIRLEMLDLLHSTRLSSLVREGGLRVPGGESEIVKRMSQGGNP